MTTFLFEKKFKNFQQYNDKRSTSGKKSAQNWGFLEKRARQRDLRYKFNINLFTFALHILSHFHINKAQGWVDLYIVDHLYQRRNLVRNL
jgi:hypothetical protein